MSLPSTMIAILSPSRSASSLEQSRIQTANIFQVTQNKILTEQLLRHCYVRWNPTHAQPKDKIPPKCTVAIPLHVHS